MLAPFTLLRHRDSLRDLGWRAIGLAAFGAVVLTIDSGSIPWIAFALAGSWGTYGYVKKQLGLESLVGLAIETLIALPFYGGYVIYIQNHGTGHLGVSVKLTLLLIGAGLFTAIPLLLFNGAANRLPYSTMGLLQYITPTLQFACGVWVFHESMPAARWIGFFIIWIALISLAFDLFKSSNAVNN